MHWQEQGKESYLSWQ